MSTDVFLDVDGVINVLPSSPKWLQKWGWGEEGAHGSGKAYLPYFGGAKTTYGFKIRWSKPLIERINTLAAREDVQFHWLTTWLGMAPNILPDLIGIEGADWPVLGDPYYKRQSAAIYPGMPLSEFKALGWWKLTAVEEHISQNPENRFVWVDDDLRVEDMAQEFIERMNSDRERVLGVSPSSDWGITPSLMEQIEQFCLTTVTN